MKIRNKITFIFILLIAFLQIVIFSFIYFFSERYTENEFYLRLSQRASIAAQAYIEKDHINLEIYDDIRTRHLQTLPNETERIYTMQMLDSIIRGESTDVNGLPVSFLKQTLNANYAEILIEDTYYTGLFYKDSKEQFLVVLSAQDLYGKSKMKNMRNLLILAFVLTIIIVSILGRYYAKHVLNPITKIISKVNSIRANNLHERLEGDENKDEISELASTFNSMLDRLETSFEIQSSFVNNASHELRNPLTAILGQTEIALNKERNREEYMTILEGIEKEAVRLDALVSSLLKLAQTDHNKEGLLIEPIRMDQMLIDIKSNIDSTNAENNIELDFNDMPDNEDLLVVQGNYSLINIALNNILDNACKFSENKRVSLKIMTDPEFIRITVTDEGIGIPAQELKNIYEPFFRGTNARGIRGFGFGLPLAYKIIKLHGGEIKVFSQEGKGTMVKVAFPNEKRGISILR